MSRELVFKCELCGKKVTENRGKGLSFAGGKMKYITVKGAEKHICSNCVEGIVALENPPTPKIPVGSGRVESLTDAPPVTPPA